MSDVTGAAFKDELRGGTPKMGLFINSHSPTVVEQLAAAPADDRLVIRDIWLLRLRALLAQAHSDEAAYPDYRDRYRNMARTLGFEGHIAWAEEMP